MWAVSRRRRSAGGVSLSLDFTGSMPAAVTVVSSPAGYAPKLDGSLQSFSANAGRRTNAGLLVEASATNGIFFSKALSNGAWTPEQATATDSAAGAPDGSSTASTLTEDGTTATHDFKQDTGANGVSYTTLCAYFKAGTKTWAAIQSNGGNATSVYFNLSNGTVGSTQVLLGSNNVTSASIVPAGNGWYRCIVNYNETCALAFLGAANGDNGRTYAGANGVAISIWNPSTSASSPIDTVGASATRAADQIRFTVPAGITKLTYTFDDNSTQLVTGVSAGAYTIPTTLNRPQIKTVVGS